MNVVAANETFWLDPTGTQKVKKVPKIGSLFPFAHSAVLEYGFYPPTFLVSLLLNSKLLITKLLRQGGWGSQNQCLLIGKKINKLLG